MRKFFASLALALALVASPAAAQYVTPVNMRDANLTLSNVQNFVTTLNTFTAQRTLTIPGAGGMNAYYLQFIDTANAINGANVLRVVAADGSLINGSANFTVAAAGVYLFIVPSPTGYSASAIYPAGASTPAGGSSGQIQYNNSGFLGGFTMSGDATTNTSTGVATLATVNANVGSFGSATQCTAFTTNAKGLITAASAVTCTPAIASITGLGTGVAAALAINIGSAGAPVLFNGAGGTPSSMTGTNITGTAAGLSIGGNAATATTATNVAVGGITGAGAGCITWLTTPSSANLRGCLTDETGTGLAYFQGGDIGTPSAGVGINLTSLNASNLASGTVAAARGGAGAINGVLAGNGSGVVSQGTCAGLSGVAASCATDATNATNITSGTLASGRLAWNGANQQAVPSNPVGTTSATGVMMGLGVTTCRFAPTFSSRVRFEISGTASNTNAGANSSFGIRYGAGAGPANGAAPTGTSLTNSASITSATANAQSAFFVSVLATALTPGTTYWYDTTLSASAGTSSLVNINCQAFEF